MVSSLPESSPILESSVSVSLASLAVVSAMPACSCLRRSSISTFIAAISAGSATGCPSAGDAPAFARLSSAILRRLNKSSIWLARMPILAESAFAPVSDGVDVSPAGATAFDSAKVFSIAPTRLNRSSSWVERMVILLVWSFWPDWTDGSDNFVSA